MAGPRDRLCQGSHLCAVLVGRRCPVVVGRVTRRVPFFFSFWVTVFRSRLLRPCRHTFQMSSSESESQLRRSSRTRKPSKIFTYEDGEPAVRTASATPGKRLGQNRAVEPVRLAGRLRCLGFRRRWMRSLDGNRFLWPCGSELPLSAATGRRNLQISDLYRFACALSPMLACHHRLVLVT